MPLHLRIALAGLAALVVAAASSEAGAQSRRGNRTGAAAPPSRGDPRYSQPPEQSGIIRWNTPNASGNLGGSSTGGGGGTGA